jgi:hypothetical protein
MVKDTGQLKDFEAFLVKLGNIPEDKIRFYIHWVRRFLRTCNYQLENINKERISQYLDSLEADEKIAEWQVKQAADAVNLYVEKYLQNRFQQVASSEKDHSEKSIDPKGSLQWKQTLEEVRNVIRLRHFSLSTEKTYLGWIARFKTFLKDRDPQLLGTDDMKTFLTDLALHKHVSSSTQNQAFNALLFLYRHILHKEVGDLTSVARAKRKFNLPAVLSKDEVNPVRKSSTF